MSAEPADDDCLGPEIRAYCAEVQRQLDTLPRDDALLARYHAEVRAVIDAKYDLTAWEQWNVPRYSGTLPAYIPALLVHPNVAFLRQSIQQACAYTTTNDARILHMSNAITFVYAYTPAYADIHERMHRRAALDCPQVHAESAQTGAMPFTSLFPRTQDSAAPDGHPIRMPLDEFLPVVRLACKWGQLTTVASETARILSAIARALGIQTDWKIVVALGYRAFAALFVVSVGQDPDIMCPRYTAALDNGRAFLWFVGQCLALVNAVYFHTRERLDAASRRSLLQLLKIGRDRVLGVDNIGVPYEGMLDAWAQRARLYWDLYRLLES